MDEEETLTDHYKILQCERTATFEELKKNYQRLILNSHPDKVDKTSREDSFIDIQKAWSVLRDPESRKQYDAMLSCQEHSECLLFASINKSEMDYDDSEHVFVYPCRCGGTYVLDANLTVSKIIIGCDECSFSIQVDMTS